MMVLITGGAHGIGKGLVDGYAQKGYQVVFTDVDLQGELLANQQENVFFEPLDSSDLAQVEPFMSYLVKKYGLPDILIHNVGFGITKPLTELSTEEFVKVQNINYISGVVLTREWLKSRETMGKVEDYGRIVLISSTRHLMSEPNGEAYAASKGAIASLTHSLAASTANSGVTVNCISPGWIHNGDVSELTEVDKRQHWSGRVGTPQDILQACLYLTDEQNNFVNGQNLYVDGGMTKTMIYV